ncbi:hypothetical protein [Maribacter luteus]|uniref:Uncharacterized protein n=1 Tax=Maribacter luteus TaxID=2594478 RepID=A0A6I2MKX5_9FLAO|nr:hypothetical protein [Maribacter luteus]MRX64378.1 hypothetical protein [Maribacter luteus]
MFHKIQFFHFYTVDNYLSLQNHFAAMDYYNEFANRSFKTPKTDLKITVQEIDPELGIDPLLYSEFEVEKDFKLDYIIPSLGSLSDNYMDLIKSNWNRKNLYTEEARRNSAKSALENLRKGLKDIKKASFLDQDVIKLIIEQLDELEDVINDIILNPYTDIKEKLRFNWHRVDIEYLFYLLRENKQIEHIGDADLGRIIDNLFEYKETDGNYYPVKGSRKHISAFNTNERGVSQSIERLKSTFNPDFFNN